MAFEYLLISCLLLILFRHVLRRPLTNLPPGPRPLPLLGNIHQLGGLPHRSLAELAHQHGPLMSLRLGLVPYLVISSPAAAAQILRKHNQVLSYRAPPDAVRALDHDKLSMVLIVSSRRVNKEQPRKIPLPLLLLAMFFHRFLEDLSSLLELLRWNFQSADLTRFEHCPLQTILQNCVHLQVTQYPSNLQNSFLCLCHDLDRKNSEQGRILGTSASAAPCLSAAVDVSPLLGIFTGPWNQNSSDTTSSCNSAPSSSIERLSFVLKNRRNRISFYSVLPASFFSSRRSSSGSYSFTYTPGPAWRALRKICNAHIFNSQRLDESKDLRQRKVRELVSVLQARARKGEPVDVGRAALTVTINLMSSTIFSEDMARYEEDSSADFKHLLRQSSVAVASPNISDYFPLLQSLDLQGRRQRASQTAQKLKDVFSIKIDDRQSSRQSRDISEPEDFLDVLLDAISAEELNRPPVEALLLDLFGAGSETTSSTVEWAMAELLRNPKAMETAREEVASVMEGSGEDAVGESDITRMPYLQDVVKETLRLHPPAPVFIPRRASETVDLAADDKCKSSYTVPTDTRILINAWAIGRDPTTWGSDADLFRPERFTAGERGHVEYKGHHMEFIPFGGGKRICPGLPLASRMMHLLLANLIWFFEWRLPEGTLPADVCMEEEFGVTLSKAEPLLAIPVLAK
ncbi:geraniol 8-hydroxylase-like [Wolffia australiana]